MASKLKLGVEKFGTEKKEEIIKKALEPYFQQVNIKAKSS